MTEAQEGKSPSELIDARIEALGDWRGEMLARVRAVIRRVDPDVVEEWKWRGVPTWCHDGILCTGETYKALVKTTFARGAALPDPSGLFNSSLEAISGARSTSTRASRSTRRRCARARRGGPERVLEAENVIGVPKIEQLYELSSRRMIGLVGVRRATSRKPARAKVETRPVYSPASAAPGGLSTG